MKRSDLDTRTLLGIIDYWGLHAWERLVENYPPKLALAAIYRDVTRDYLDYGVVATRPWLTDKGRALLAEYAKPKEAA